MDHSVDAALWEREFDDLMAGVAARFGRVETRRAAGKLVAGLVSGLDRKNCWTIAEHVGDDSPDRLQYLLGRAVWDDIGVRDDLRRYVLGRLGDSEAVLAVDETGDLKKGVETVGVQRQYTGTAGRIENSQVAVYLSYATEVVYTFLDRALYLPRSWTEDPDRRAAAGVPADAEFATKPELATRMITDALDSGVNAAWVTGDEVYGADPSLRAELESRRVGYVLAIGCDRRVVVNTGPTRVDQLACELPKIAWQALSAGDGAKGLRVYDWAWIDIEAGGEQPAHGRRYLLIRRNRRTSELAYYRCYTPRPAALPVLAGVAGRRWTIAKNFQTAKGLVGLDQHQVRRWKSWHRWTILALLAHAFLTALAITANIAEPAPSDRIALTRNEIQHLFNALIGNPVHSLAYRLHWSTWRRHHQHRAKTSHYQRQST